MGLFYVSKESNSIYAFCWVSLTVNAILTKRTGEQVKSSLLICFLYHGFVKEKGPQCCAMETHKWFLKWAGVQKNLCLITTATKKMKYTCDLQRGPNNGVRPVKLLPVPVHAGQAAVM